MASFLFTTWTILAEMAPYLLFGFFIAGILSVVVPASWIERHLGGSGVTPIVKAAIFGIPLPLCSCSVLPVATAIRRHGASRASTASFLLATPQTGVDSILATYALLGSLFAVFRPLAALITGVLGGLIIKFFGGKDTTTAKKPQHEEHCEKHATNKMPPLLRMLRHGFIKLPADIGVALAIGIVIAAIISVLVPAGMFAPYLGGGIVAIIIMILFGVPLYVCATASIPLAVGFMHLGASPGAALAFLIAGPATNAAAFTTIWKVLGKRPALLYLVTIAISAIFCAYAFDFIVDTIALPISDYAHNGPSIFSHLAAIALVIITPIAYYLDRKR